MFGLTISSIWYWCSDQVIVQRALAAKSMVYAKGGCVFASYLKLLPLWIMVFPGMAARALFPNEVACANPEECLATCGSRYANVSTVPAPLLTAVIIFSHYFAMSAFL